MVCVLPGYLLEAHLFRKKKKLSTLEVQTDESTEQFYWYTFHKTRDAERPHTVQYDRSESLNRLQNVLILPC